MGFLEIFLLVIAVLLAATGLFALVATWTAPHILDNRFMRWLTTGKRLAPTRANRTLVACWSTLIGGHFLFMVCGYRMISFIVLAAWLPLAFIVFKRSSRRAPGA